MTIDCRTFNRPGQGRGGGRGGEADEQSHVGWDQIGHSSLEGSRTACRGRVTEAALPRSITTPTIQLALATPSPNRFVIPLLFPHPHTFIRSSVPISPHHILAGTSDGAWRPTEVVTTRADVIHQTGAAADEGWTSFHASSLVCFKSPPVQAKTLLSGTSTLDSDFRWLRAGKGRMEMALQGIYSLSTFHDVLQQPLDLRPCTVLYSTGQHSCFHPMPLMQTR